MEPEAAEGDAAARLDLGRQSRARQYARTRRRLLALDLLLGALYLGVWVFAGLGHAVLDWLPSNATIGSSWPLRLLLIAAALGLPWTVINLPLSIYRGFLLPHRYDMSTQTIQGWMMDQLKSGLISLALGIPILLGFYQLMRAAPASWWLWSALGLTLVTTVLSAVAPALIMPIFFKIEPLPEAWSDLKARLLAMAESAGAHIEAVNRIDLSRRTRAANAALAGLGRTRQILLGDTLLSEFSPPEIETIFAHELGHHVHADVPKSIAFESGLNLATFFLLQRAMISAADGLGLVDVHDAAGLPLVALLLGLFGLVSMPISNAFSRWRERAADQFALQATGLPAAYVSALTRLANQNLAEVDPEPWVVFLFGSHPPLAQRIAAARAFEAGAK